MDVIIRADALTKGYKTKKGEWIKALDAVSLDIQKGEIFGLLGTNGAGKTTIVRILSTLIYPDGGQASVMGYNVKKHPKEIRKNIGVCLGNKMVYHKMTARDNLRFFGKIYDVRNLDNKIDELAEFFDIKDRIDDLVENYSMGMKTKLAVMRAFIHDPPIVFLDEPTFGLDPGTGYKLRQRIKEMRDKEGKTIILCTHHLLEAEELCDTIAVLRKGKTVAVDTAEGLKRKVDSSKDVCIQFTHEKDAAVMSELFDVSQRKEKIVIPLSNSHLLHVLLQKVHEGNMEIQDIRVNKPTLEEAFLKMTS
ncbi:ABC transporter ATP-binding protein [Patescibacteria group bacterium]|nr:ABC transporter ATP-binding protein [Patescibacteria group bacterium]